MHRIPGKGSNQSQHRMGGFGDETPAAGKLQNCHTIILCGISSHAKLSFTYGNIGISRLD